jgi:hypothetical protein
MRIAACCVLFETWLLALGEHMIQMSGNKALRKICASEKGEVSNE